MRILVLIILALLTVDGIFSSSFADFAPPVQITEQKFSTDCIVATSYKYRGKGNPQITIRNSCSENIIINDVLTSSDANFPKTSILPIKAYLQGPGSFLQGKELNKGCDFWSKIRSIFSSTMNCKSGQIPRGYMLSFPITGGAYFTILGNPDISIEGKLVDPRSP